MISDDDPESLASTDGKTAIPVFSCSQKAGARLVDAITDGKDVPLSIERYLPPEPEAGEEKGVCSAAAHDRRCTSQEAAFQAANWGKAGVKFAPYECMSGFW